MPIVDHATRLITCKLVFYGPGRSGKTTNLTYLHAALPTGQVGSLTSLATRRDRTLFFDYLPVDLGTVGAYRVRFQLYTVPGQPYYRAIRQLVLQGADGVAFVADSQRHRWEENVESLQDLHANLAEHAAVGAPVQQAGPAAGTRRIGGRAVGRTQLPGRPRVRGRCAARRRGVRDAALAGHARAAAAWRR